MVKVVPRLGNTISFEVDTNHPRQVWVRTESIIATRKLVKHHLDEIAQQRTPGEGDEKNNGSENNIVLDSRWAANRAEHGLTKHKKLVKTPRAT